MPTTDKLREALDAWKRVNDEYAAMMAEVTAGAPLDIELLSQKLGEVEVLHGTWIEMAARRDEGEPGPA